MRTALILISLAFVAPASAEILSGYSGGSSGILSGYSAGGENNELFNGSGSNFVNRNTNCCPISKPHRAAHQRKLEKQRAEQARLNSLPPPCGVYGRAPAGCKRGL